MDKTINDKLMFIPGDVNKITPSVDLKYWLKCFSNKLNSTNVSKVLSQQIG